jgi:hypothetical protein
VWLFLGVALGASFTTACDASDAIVARRDGTSDTPSRGPRGRVVVSGGTLLTDRGTRLHGVTVGSDAGLDFGLEQNPEGTRGVVRSFFDELALESGLNFVHVYLENQTTEHGSGLSFGDLLVEEAEHAGIYLLVGLGSGTLLGEFDRARADQFWNLYAPRYANRTHVLYELHNGPERTCDAPWAPESIALENEVFTLIRSQAPDTHVVTFSYVATPTDATLASNIEATSIDWTNASVGFHATDDCRPLGDLAMLPPTPAENPVALLATELPLQADAWQPAAVALEAGRLSWASFRWLEAGSNMAIFRAEHDTASVSWCPDFGTWPTDSGSCSE